MSYQIKSTPFFRRMVNTSKKNGQLQRLKEEYERNDRSIELKMRQVRLKRLFREIQEIKESSSSFQTQRRRPKMSDEIRMETFVKSRELGKEYSKLNAIMVENCAAKVKVLANQYGKNVNCDDQRKLREKRISYGNNCSRINIQNFVVSRRRNPNDDRNWEAEKKRERLSKRISYGNALSRKNIITMKKRNGKHKPENVNAKNDQDDNDNIVKLHEDEEEENEGDHIFTNNQYDNHPSDDDDAQERKLAIEQIMQSVDDDADEFLPVEHDDDSDSSYIDEYVLRTISNGTHLPKRENYENTDNTDNSDNSFKTSNEAEISIADLVETDNYYSEPGPSRLRPIKILPEPIQISEIVKKEVEPLKSSELTDVVVAPLNEKHESQVQKFVKLFEPHAHEVNQKKAIEYGTSKLFSIFKHNHYD